VQVYNKRQLMLEFREYTVFANNNFVAFSKEERTAIKCMAAFAENKASLSTYNPSWVAFEGRSSPTNHWEIQSSTLPENVCLLPQKEVQHQESTTVMPNVSHYLRQKLL
jgi:hypothetical protein